MNPSHNCPDASTHSLEVTVARIEGKLDALTSVMSESKERQAEHEQRIRALEQRPEPLTGRALWAFAVSFIGAAAAVSALVQFLIDGPAPR